MAVYKVIQDIESEDKLLGPLTLKGLVYAMIVGALLFIDFRLLLTGVLGPLKWIVVLLSLPPIILFGVLASPLGREQPTEVWLLSRIRFMTQARIRVWNQSGITNLVTVTAPKKVEAFLVKNLNQSEVKSRLEALATTLDSRGWAVKNANVNMGGFSGYFDAQEDTERLIDTSAIVKEVPVVDVHASDDILDENNNQTAQNFQNLIKEAEDQRRAELQKKLEVARVAEEEKDDDLDRRLHSASIHDVKPLNSLPRGGIRQQSPPKQNSATQNSSDGMTEATRAAKLELAQSGNDLSVASIAKLAVHNDAGSGEVSIALH